MSDRHTHGERLPAKSLEKTLDELRGEIAANLAIDHTRLRYFDAGEPIVGTMSPAASELAFAKADHIVTTRPLSGRHRGTRSTLSHHGRTHLQARAVRYGESVRQAFASLDHGGVRGGPCDAGGDKRGAYGGD